MPAAGDAHGVRTHGMMKLRTPARQAKRALVLHVVPCGRDRRLGAARHGVVGICGAGYGWAAYYYMCQHTWQLQRRQRLVALVSHGSCKTAAEQNWRPARPRTRHGGALAEAGRRLAPLHWRRAR